MFWIAVVVVVWPYQYLVVVPLQILWSIVFGVGSGMPPWDWDPEKGRVPDVRPWFLDQLRTSFARDDT